MTTTPMSTALHTAVAGTADRSVEAGRFFDDLMALDPEIRRGLYRQVMGEQRFFGLVLAHAKRTQGTEYALWSDDPTGFVEDVLHETTWSKQRAVLTSIGKHLETAVPSAVGTGKTHIAARAVLWRSLAYPIGTSTTVTTATRFRQVQRQMWPHIRKLVKKANLPLQADQTQLRGYTASGVLWDVAYGFTAPAHDEAAMQGIHAPRIFVVVDEAGGLSPRIGRSIRGILTGSDSRALYIGNPPTDEEGSWFEQKCAEEEVSVIRISTYDAPKLTGEKTLRCLDCPPEMPRHPLGDHIVDEKWLKGTLKDYGEDSPYVAAKVHARFPKGGPSRTIPSDWIELAVEAPEPDPLRPVSGCAECAAKTHRHYVRIEDVAPGDRDGQWYVPWKPWVRLGVDVAADGGDEFVISRMVGDLITVRHTSRGAVNSDPTHVAGVILAEIKAATALATALGSTTPVRCKIDSIGVGWGITGTLAGWQREQVHKAEIVPVIVSEGTYREDEPETLRPYRKRDEMWLTGRSTLRPREIEGSAFRKSLVRLRVPERAQRQLGAPKYTTNSGGFTVVESKKSLRERGMNSPDQAEAILMAPYEPIQKPPEPEGFIALVGG